MKLGRLFFINASLVIVSVVLGLYAITGTVLFGSNPMDKMPTWAFCCLLSVSLLSFIALIFINIKKSEYKPSVPFAVALSIAFVTSLISILVFKNESAFIVSLQDGTANQIFHSVDGITRFEYIFQFLLLMVVVFTLIDVVPKIFKGTPLIKYFCFIGIIVVAVTIIYSYATEYNSYYHFISEPDHFWLLQYAAHSMFPNKNAYAITLFSGIVACLYLHQEKYKWYWAVGALFILINIFFTMSKATLLIGVLLVLGYFILRFIQTIKTHFKRNMITLGAVLSLIVTAVIAISILDATKGNVWSSVLNMFNLANGLSTAGSRTVIWHKVVQILNQTNWVSGPGFHIFNDLLLEFNSLEIPTTSNPDITQFAHNMFLELIGNGGLILLLVAVLLIAYLVYVLVNALKEHKTLATFEFILIGVLLIYAFFESGSFIFPNTLEYAFICFLVFVPIFTLKSDLKLKYNL